MFARVEIVHPTERERKILRKPRRAADTLHRLVDSVKGIELTRDLLLFHRLQSRFRELFDDGSDELVLAVIAAALFQPFAEFLIFLGNIDELSEMLEILFQTGIQTPIRIEKGVKFFLVLLIVLVQRAARKHTRDLVKRVELFTRERAYLLSVQFQEQRDIVL